MYKSILFNTEMVKAILDGRKTVTRRIVKPQPDKRHQSKLGYVTDSTDKSRIGCFGFGLDEYGGSIQYAKPKYNIGDIMWIRETVWQKASGTLGIDGETETVLWNEFKYISTDKKPEVGWSYSWIKRPSIHMPKSAARIFLKVTDVRVENVQDITDEQCMKEGISEEKVTLIEDMIQNLQGCNAEIQNGSAEKSIFGNLWDSTVKNENYFYSANPYVWVIEFERCEKPEDF